MLRFSHARRNLHELSYLFMQCKAVYLFVFFFSLFLVILALFQLKSMESVEPFKLLAITYGK